MDPSRLSKSVADPAARGVSRLVQAALGALEPVYRGIMRRRNIAFDCQLKKSVAVPVPVISIGNLTTGGTGKTPVVRWVARLLERENRHPVIISRGYKSRNGQPNDEAQELQTYLPSVPHVQNADRVAAARQAIDEHGAGSIVMDDGFQHRRLRRNLDIVLVDATCPFGFDRLLPRGRLREPVESLSRSDAVVITRTDQVDPDQLREIEQRVAAWIAIERIARIRFERNGWMQAEGGELPLEHLAGQRVVGFCGIGNPKAFRRTLEQSSLELAEFVAWPDHHAFRPQDLKRLDSIVVRHSANRLVCTVKDLVKIRQLPAPSCPVLGLSITVGWETGESMLRQMIQETAEQES